MDLCAGSDHELGTFSDFYIQIGLTTKGLANYQEVLKAVFKYSQRLMETGPQDYVFNECKTVGQMSFDFLEKGDEMSYCVNTAKKFQKFSALEDMPHLLRHQHVTDNWNTELNQKYARELANPANTLTFLTS